MLVPKRGRSVQRTRTKPGNPYALNENNLSPENRNLQQQGQLSNSAQLPCSLLHLEIYNCPKNICRTWGPLNLYHAETCRCISAAGSEIMLGSKQVSFFSGSMHHLHHVNEGAQTLVDGVEAGGGRQAIRLTLTVIIIMIAMLVRITV